MGGGGGGKNEQLDVLYQFVYGGRVRISRTHLAQLLFVTGTDGFNAHILDFYDESGLQGSLRFGGHQRMM